MLERASAYFHLQQALPSTLLTFTLITFLLPIILAALISHHTPLTPRHLVLTQCFSLLVLGIFLATLATLNFSLAFLIGLLSTPFSFLGPSLSATSQEPRLSRTMKLFESGLLQLVSPPVVAFAVCRWAGVDVGEMLAEAAFGWRVSGLWTQVVVWCVWWPAWLVGAVVVSPVL